MSAYLAASRAEELAQQHNPEGLVPFPFEKILEMESNLELYVVPLEQAELSGVISYLKDTNTFEIFINSNKPSTRQYFTTAHEFGHYFLHAEQVKAAEISVDTEERDDLIPGLYRLDDLSLPTQLEVEANNFAASLIMPQAQVIKAWQKLEDIQACAEVFKVSAAAMSVRLERLGLIS